MQGEDSNLTERNQDKEECLDAQTHFQCTPAGFLRICFIKSSMKALAIQTYFGGEYFQLDEDFEVPADLVSSLGLKTNRVSAGRYRIRRGAACFIVDFDPPLRLRQIEWGHEAAACSAST